MNVMACLVYRKIRFGDYKECATCAAISATTHHDRSFFSTALMHGESPRRVPVVQPNDNNDMDQEKLSESLNGDHEPVSIIGVRSLNSRLR